jgi:aspartyl/asparaginyl beta-hydroxylase (cupin superfamily)
MNASVTEPLIIHTRHSFYNGTLPAFYQAKDFPELNIISESWKVILTELQAYESQHGQMTGLSTYTPPGTSEANPWSNLYLENFMWHYHANRKHFPKTCALLAQIPGLTFASFASLAAGGKLEPHYGDTNAVIRCHLGLRIPAPHPVCGIEAGTEQQGWEEGKITMFSEAHRHWVWNNSSQKRYVLVFDIIHPFWANNKEWMCARVLGAQTLVFLESKLSVLKKLPDSWLPPFVWLLALAWRIYLPFQRKLGGIFYK